MDINIDYMHASLYDEINGTNTKVDNLKIAIDARE